MSNQFTPLALRGPDDLAVLGRTLSDLRGIRFDNDEGGATPPVPTPPVLTPAPAAPAAPVEAPAPPVTPGAPAGWDGKIESLDPAAQKIITDLRTEAATNRVKATAADARTAAILAAAGITPEGDADPVEVAAQSKADALTARRELAVFKAAALEGADPSKLLDRTSFTTSIAGIDPSDGPALAAAIKAAVETDSTLKAARAAGASSVETPGGTGELGQITEAQLAQMTPEQITEAYEKGLLKNLL